MAASIIPGRARLRIKFKRPRLPPPDPDPPRRVSWVVSSAKLWLFRWPIIETEIGYVSAKTRAEAMLKAREKFPEEPRLRVAVSRGDG